MTEHGAVDVYLDLMDAQREAIFARLAGISQERLWQRPTAKEWSAGENLDHARLALRSFRRVFVMLYPILSPIGRWRRNRPYEAAIDDVYARPGFPLWIGFVWRPHHTGARPVSLSTLYEETVGEHLAVRAFYTGKDERVLGHMPLYDPTIGAFNFVQGLRVGVYHDAHHFRNIERLLQTQQP